MSFTDARTGRKIRLPENAFVLMLKDGGSIAASAMKLAGHPQISKLKADKNSRQLAARFDGVSITLSLTDQNGRLLAEWRAILRDGSEYLRQEVTLKPASGDVPISQVRLIDVDLPGAIVQGRVKGSPIVAGNLFTAFEHPLSVSKVEGGRAVCYMDRELPLKAGHSVTYSSVIGTTDEGQMRRGFLNYIERERAHPYRSFLHYNSWYDIGYFSRYSEAEAIASIRTIGIELAVKRGAVLSSFLFDDGWDDPATLWHFNSGFPQGFTNVREIAAEFGAAPGVWLSPWGGYGKPKQERLEFARKAGYETNSGGFALSGPKYYQLFRDTCQQMIRLYGVNQFKFDGTGNADRVIPGSEFDSDFDAAINLIGELRNLQSDLFVNLTTGTYPSPFWLRYADSIWRDGEDHDFAGVGRPRQRWITYRDAQTYKNVVQGGPLFPLNSLMLHGIIFAKHAHDLNSDPGDDFNDEVRSYFGTGTQLQEMYISPDLISQRNWDRLAEAANWSRNSAAVLIDTHWIGGDPGALEHYGWASWMNVRGIPATGIIVLRNPSDKEQSISIDPQAAFELPSNAPPVYKAVPPWKEDRGNPGIRLEAGRKHSFDLKPFEVLTLQAVAVT